MSVFRPVTAVSGTRQVFDQIKGSIEEGILKPGDRLPSQWELAARFGVSRATVRGAIQSLASVGYLEVRHGVGTLVSPRVTTLEDPACWLPWLTAHKEDVVALLEVREALEVKAAALAAACVARSPVGAREDGPARGDGRVGEDRVVAGLLAAIARTLTEMADACERNDVMTLERIDLEFHAALAELSGNGYLRRLAKSVNHVFVDRRAVMTIPGRAAISLTEHRRIAEAVRAGDPARAAAAMGDHLASIKRIIVGLEGTPGVHPASPSRTP